MLFRSYNPNRAPIYYAVTGRTDSFYTEELEMRKTLDFPPYERLIRLVFRSPSQKNAENAAGEAVGILQNEVAKLSSKKSEAKPEILGASECPIEKIAMNHRYQILLRGKNIRTLQNLAFHLLNDYKKPQDVYIETDVDPVSLL